MTRLHQNLLTFATLLVPILLVGPAFAQELLTNPGFEEIADNGIPTGWGRHAGGVPESVLQVVDDAHSGQHAVRLIDTGPRERESKYSIGVVQTVEAEGDKFYKGSVWVKALARNNQGALNIQIRFLPSNKLHQVQLKPPIGGGQKLHFHNYGFACREAIMADVAGDGVKLLAATADAVTCLVP